MQNKDEKALFEKRWSFYFGQKRYYSVFVVRKHKTNRENLVWEKSVRCVNIVRSWLLCRWHNSKLTGNVVLFWVPLKFRSRSSIGLKFSKISIARWIECEHCDTHWHKRCQTTLCVRSKLRKCEIAAHNQTMSLVEVMPKQQDTTCQEGESKRNFERQTHFCACTNIF